MRTRTISIAVAIAFIVSGLAITQGTASKASTQSILTDYTYNPYSSSFAAGDVPSNVQSVILPFPTDWGTIGMGAGSEVINYLYIETVHIPTWVIMYDVLVNYWFYNESGHSGRIFKDYWTGWYTIRNDTNVAIYERYASAPSAYSGSTPEFRITLRVAILKHDPVIRFDGWLQILNATSLIQSFDMNLWAYYGDSGAVDANNYSRSLSYRYNSSAGWALGVVGESSYGYFGGNSVTYFSNFQLNRTEHRMSESLHGQQLVVLGSTVASMYAMADKVGSVWNHDELVDNYNFVIAENPDRFDALDYFPATGYTVYPSGTTETIYASGTTRTLNLQANPILNYAETPLVTFVDDLSQARGDSADWDWAFATAERYGIPLTLNAYGWDVVGAYEINSWINLSDERVGTLFEIADHNYNHSNFYTSPQGYDYQKTTMDLTQAKWATYTDIPIVSDSLAFNAWSFNTWDAMGAAGIKNIRLGLDDWQSPRDYNLSGAATWMARFQDQAVGTTGNTSNLAKMGLWGYWAHQGHTTDFDTAPEKTSVETYWAWVQNQTQLIPVTFSQFSDIWHHRIEYSTADGTGVYNLTTCEVNHRILLEPVNGKLPILWDVTDDSSAGNETYDSGRGTMTVNMRAGHVYHEVGSMTVSTSSINITATIWNPTGPGIVAQWKANGTSATTFTLSGLDSDVGYKVYVDSVQILQQLKGLTELTFTYSGPWSEHTFEVVTWELTPRSDMWASFTYSIEGLKVEFIDTTYPQSTMTIWNFGDGFGSRNPYPTHTYQNSGTYQVSMMAYDEYGHYNTAQTTITVELGPSTPLEHTGTGWNIYLGNGTVIGISAAGLLISGALSLVSSWYIPDIPIITIRARRLYGVLAILAALYFALFVKGISFGG